MRSGPPTYLAQYVAALPGPIVPMVALSDSTVITVILRNMSASSFVAPANKRGNSFVRSMTGHRGHFRDRCQNLTGDRPCGPRALLVISLLKELWLMSALSQKQTFAF